MFARLLILLIFIILIDGINYLGLRALMKNYKDSGIYKLNFYLYFGLTIGIFIWFGLNLLITQDPGIDHVKYRSYFLIFGIFLLIYIPRFVFNFFTILEGLYRLLRIPFSGGRRFAVKRNQHKVYAMLIIGLILSIVSFFVVLHGLTYGKSNYLVKNQIIYIKNLPAAFHDFKIVQFSDTHFGSFKSETDVKKGLDLINQQDADIICFTGDMVNNVVDEIYPYRNLLTNLKAKHGKFSILGNHDMSDYVKWQNFELKQSYLDKLVESQEDCGFNVLMNENKIIKIGGDSIAIIGVENWGKPPFKQYGKLGLAMEGIEKVPTKILLSHDPSHWKSEVLNKTNIKLTLSGHTHGMQLGINIGWLKWSPVQYLYENWLGLYNENNQYLYVNPGFGFIAFPGRIGIRPEITVITLKSAK